MKLNEKQQEVRRNISELNNAITEAIDKICQEHDYEITYAEINSALTDRLRSNLGYELREMWKKDDEIINYADLVNKLDIRDLT